MVILGLGSNIGNRLGYLRQALSFLEGHQDISVKYVSPVYQSDAQLPDNPQPGWDQFYFNAAVACETQLAPEDLLQQVKYIEKQVGRERADRWAPRVIDIDILLFHDREIKTEALTTPHKQLLQRPFALWPLLDVHPHWNYPRNLVQGWGTRFEGRAPFRTQQVPYRLEGPRFVGVLNITPDSFSDGGEFNSVEKAVARATQLFTSGAEIIDIGAESTRPYESQAITPQQEWQRLEPVLAALKAKWSKEMFKPYISVDTRHYDVAESAINQGVDWINDVTGFSDANMVNVVRDAAVKLVCMHSLSFPPTQDDTLLLDEDPIKQVYQWGDAKLQRLQQQGIDVSRVIFDMGIGFGKTHEQSIALLQRAHAFKDLGCEMLAGHSRKSFHSIISGVTAKERDLETAIGTVELFNQGVDYLRVHDVSVNARAVAMHKRLWVRG